MAEIITDQGGYIQTSTFVDQVDERTEGGLKLSVIFDGNNYEVDAKNVVHAWNAYGNSEKFLPERLSETI